ncbi:solute carrier organic anion transporter family member 74D [Drosophila busckii]|uniref:solute carrier organic anion transporter family member 74D n=1 Tax=Drosophila busckii TaxID=30019 RepID=UPI00083ED025|nr:solute carrier organic anion transporter family member 74D [Drosophila busckii]
MLSFNIKYYKVPIIYFIRLHVSCSCKISKEPHEQTKFLNEKQAAVEEAHECGFWFLRGPQLQRFATENVYVVVYGIAGCLITMAYSYFTGTITTLEKRYKIPSQVSAVITIGNDISTTFTSAFLGYYAGRGHRPRWISLGLVIIACFCLLMTVPHLLYGSGATALQLTSEFATNLNVSESADRSLCNKLEEDCFETTSWTPIALLFAAQFISGVGCSLFYTLGVSYMDDNTNKAKTPALLSWSAFLRMLGPALGFSFASLCLRLYISPELSPLIQRDDPRWLGAWWLGWIILTVILLLSALSMCMFPKALPGTIVRSQPLTELSLKHMLQCIRRLLRNKVYVFNNLASIFYLFGYMPYWYFTPKYIETQYKQSASKAAMATGTFGLGFSAAGVLLFGMFISKYKPSARAFAAWNALVDLLTVAGLIGYVFIGCDGSDSATAMSPYNACSSTCHCEYVHFAPICAADNVTYISACHAGCSSKQQNELGIMEYSDCKCISNSTVVSQPLIATAGACPVDCSQQFLIFLAVMCLLKFVGASARTSNLLLALRCVSAEDKSIALGFASMILAILTFIPSPIFFGWLFDFNCVVWGKICGSRGLLGQGNCWLYDTKSLRYTMNIVAAACIFLGSFWNIAVWYYAKNLKIFDEQEHNAKELELEEPIKLET